MASPRRARSAHASRPAENSGPPSSSAAPTAARSGGRKGGASRPLGVWPGGVPRVPSRTRSGAGRWHSGRGRSSEDPEDGASEGCGGCCPASAQYASWLPLPLPDELSRRDRLREESVLHPADGTGAKGRRLPTTTARPATRMQYSTTAMLTRTRPGDNPRGCVTSHQEPSLIRPSRAPRGPTPLEPRTSRGSAQVTKELEPKA